MSVVIICITIGQLHTEYIISVKLVIEIDFSTYYYVNHVNVRVCLGPKCEIRSESSPFKRLSILQDNKTDLLTGKVHDEKTAINVMLCTKTLQILESFIQSPIPIFKPL